MFRLITSDLDGTLLDPITHAVPPEVFDLIRSFYQEGIFFAVASGRQLTNVRRLFAPVDSLMYYICENGALTAHSGTITGFTPIPDQWCKEIISDLQHFGMNLLLSAPHFTYVLEENRSFSDDMFYRLRNACCVIRNTDNIMEPLIKISGHLTKNMQPAVAFLMQKWAGRINAVLAGTEWFDFTLTNKATGITQLCTQLGLESKDVVSFGDYFNDLSMLEMVGHPFVMENAPVAMKKPGFKRCRSVPETLESLLRQVKENAL